MVSPDLPQIGESRLLNPKRSAHATIRGYLYQTCLGVLRWLDLQPDEILLCEGDEDLDRFLLGGGSISEQVKAYTGALSLSDRAVLESLGNFLRSYVALRKRGETRRFLFTTTAQEKRTTAKGLDFALLADWKAGKRTKKVTAGVRSLFKPAKKTDRHGEETTDAIAWLDGQPEGWKDFMDAVEWSFDAPDLEAVRQRIKDRLALREDTSALPAETFLERLISHVFSTSIHPNSENRQLTPKTLSDLAETARTDLGNWVKTPAAERLRTVWDELRQVHRLLGDNIATLPENAAPGKLLTAAYEVIPFDQKGRREELDFLADWCKDEKRENVLLLTGEGGSGKTRLMIEWCRHLRHQGWHAGFLRRDRKAEDLDPLLEGVAPRLVVVDYAETRLEAVEPLLLKMGLTAEGGGPKLRLVLLARRPSEWWTNLPRQGHEVEDLLLRSPEPRAITPLIPNDPEEKKRAFQMALEGFSLQMGHKPPRDFHTPDLTRREFERVLYLHMAALAAIRGERIESAEGALQQTLAHERLFWDQQVSSLRLDGAWTPSVKDALASAVAAFTLVGGAKSRHHAQTILGRLLKDSSLQTQHLAALLGLLRQLYTGREEDGRYIDPLQPDLLGEELTAHTLHTDGGFLGRILGGSDLHESYSVLTVLTRLAQRRKSFEDWIGFALRSQLKPLARVALDVAIETGDPIGTQLAAVLEESDSIDVIVQVQKLSDDNKFSFSVPLLEVAYVATKRAISFFQARRNELTEEEQSEYASLYDHLGTRLSRIGRPQDALEATKEAVQILRHLVQQRPDAFLPTLAGSLSNLGARLNAVGRKKEALDAINEAVQILRRLDQQQPHLLRPDLAMSLDNLGNMHSLFEQREDALAATEEAVKIFRRLVKLDDFRPDLAISLNNLGNRLSEIGRTEDALGAIDEAVQIHRSLVQQRPDAFRTHLARSLNNLGIVLGKLERNADAFKAFEEAIQALSFFFQRHPAAFAAQMVTVIKNYNEQAEALGIKPNETIIGPVEEIFRAFSQEAQRLAMESG